MPVNRPLLPGDLESIAMSVKKLLFVLLFIALALPSFAAPDEPPLDRARARELYQKSQRGETLNPEDQAYLDRAKRIIQGQNNGNDKARAEAMRNLPPPRSSTGLIPLSDLGTNLYKGEDGGLYGKGSNMPPPAHLAAALQEAAQVKPRNAEGKSAADGKIVLISIGMSNTTMEFSRFKADADALTTKAPSVVIVDGAQGGKTGRVWANPAAPAWEELDNRLQRAGVSAAQVQVVWIKQAESGPAQLGEFPAHARVLETNLVSCLNTLKKKFPNLRLAYLSSRIYAGYATTPLNPEPYAYESAFAMRWLIQDQIAGTPALNYSSAHGEVRSPLVLWGPYLWADGVKPRQSDGLVYQREDLVERDGTHPSDSARQKVSALLLRFFQNDPTTKPWFVK